jgi:predicted nucleotidyltransferase
MTAGQAQSVETSLQAIRRRIAQELGTDVREQITFGSATRGTNLPLRADPLSDVDHMVVFDNSADYRPQTFLARLKRLAEKYYPLSVAKQSHPAVVLILNHIRFDLVPAYKDWWGDYRIPASRSEFADWMDTNPNDLNPVVERRHRETGYNLKPVIRLLKYWNAKNGYVYQTFALEKAIAGQYYPFCSSLRDYFYSAVDGLDPWSLGQVAAAKVERAQEIVAKAKREEGRGYPSRAEDEIRHLIPPMS